MKQLAKLCLLALAATPWTATAQNAAATDKVDFLGFVAYSDSWTDSGTNNPQGGFYTFSTDANEGFTAASPTGRVEGNEVTSPLLLRHTAKALSARSASVPVM